MLKKIASIVTLFALGILFIFLTVQEKEYLNEPIIDQYEYNDELSDVKELYVTILDSENYTFTEMNENPYEDIKIEVIVQEGKDGTPKPGFYGYSLTEANGDLEIRGQSSRLKEQKSYKITLDENIGLWEGYQIINLNKHPYDDVRVRNKLSLDYTRNISGITSLSTQFVHLYIKDLSGGDYSQGFVDYGLFTQVENVDSNYLEKRGLADGLLYKAEYFEFYRYPETLLLTNDPNYSEDNFELLLEIKGDDNHQKLIEMLDAVNNQFSNINDVINKYFDKENYLTWLAINILFGNVDTNSKNFFLYSPEDSNKWYFLPWDYDKGWSSQQLKYRPPWQQGISNYWGVVLHRKFFMDSDNIDDLTKKIEELSGKFSKEETEKLINSYLPVLQQYLSTQPDNQYIDLEDVYYKLKMLPDVIEDSKKRYYQSLENPQPVFMGKPQNYGDYYIFPWTNSYDFQNDIITYSVEISDTPTFDNILYSEKGIKDNQYILFGIPPGTYYWKLTIFDSKGNQQAAFDYHIEDNLYYFSIQKFIVEK